MMRASKTHKTIDDDETYLKNISDYYHFTMHATPESNRSYSYSINDKSLLMADFCILMHGRHQPANYANHIQQYSPRPFIQIVPVRISPAISEASSKA
jgi:hypothetical protein